MGTPSSLDLYSAGNIDGAVTAALAEVRAAPMDLPARLRLCELFVAQGSLERADKQLDLISTQDPSTGPGVSLFRQLLRAAEARASFHRDGRVPDVIAEPDTTMRAALQAATLFRLGDAVQAAAMVEAADRSRPAIAGTCDGQPFTDFRDADDLTATYLEVFAPNGKYYVLPFSLVRSITFQPLKTIRDLIWRPAEISCVGGLNGFVYFPTTYAGSETLEAKLRLGRATEWSDSSPVRGRGQRIFLVGEDAKAISAIGRIEFAIKEPTAAVAPSLGGAHAF